jgi:phosphoribosylformimino-5-aminoimidazole carboxamide ribotide isomerase
VKSDASRVPDRFSPAGGRGEVTILSRPYGQSIIFRDSSRGFQSTGRNFFPMRFLPVLDIQNGIVVRAVAGRRSEYRPLVSRLTDSTDPVVVARAIRDRFGWNEFYVADLDSIAACGLATNASHLDRLRAEGFSLWLDAGVRTADDADQIADQGIERVVVGLETIAGPTEWQTIVQRLGSERAVFSLDLRGGEPITSTDAWGTSDALAIADRVVADGGRQVILLDLDRVGTGAGPGTDSLCSELMRRHPGIAVYAGGGVRGWDDVRRLEAAGVATVLVASALHDGKLD